jgi:mono/diheme cytochrome c family protein
MELPEPPEMKRTPEQVAAGEGLYHAYCSTCHGPGAIGSGGGTPDLRYSTASVHASWDAIVRGGAYTGKGMASFASVLDEDESTAIQAYVIDQAEQTIALCESTYRENYPELLESACARPQTAAAP